MKFNKIIKVQLLVFLVFFSQLVYSQRSPAQEISKMPIFSGWEKLLWGTSETDVRRTYESQLTILDTILKYRDGEYYCPFEIRNYKISRYDNFTVAFLFDEKTKKLAVVNITMESPRNILYILQDLKANLGEKLGKPQIIEESPAYKIKWDFPDTEVELRHLYLKSFDKVLLNSVVLTYQKRMQAQQNNISTTRGEINKPEIKLEESTVYKLYPTENQWTFIKLDTRNGKMWQVYFNVSAEGFQGEKDLNIRPLILSDVEINGRFTLVPTKNIYNFLLLDQLTGKTFQVQWNDDYFNRLVEPIL